MGKQPAGRLSGAVYFELWSGGYTCASLRETTWTAASRTSSRNRFSVEPFIRISQRDPRSLTENHVGDAFALCERDETVGWLVRFDPHDGRAEFLGHRDVALQRVAILAARCAPAPRAASRRTRRTTARRDGRQFARPCGYPWRRAVRAHAHHHAFGISAGSRPSLCRCEAAFSPISSATARSASSRSVERFVSRKKFARACSTFSGRYTFPCRSLVCSSSP